MELKKKLRYKMSNKQFIKEILFGKIHKWNYMF